ncbi:MULTISPECIES: DeoR/GlpR family DNA-binding transcription regulator [unclassified Marinitoga]|uniref:DeoR/GlpR family DNA-binding transcription regulator n=1 Tax=unclassified Marinitoga TaxID=2640159 RepID=UPI00064146FD|nr:MULTISPECIES: DeoR/GlpR family DNA-binding transcription regulator [unclassified Marinitoga]KLO24612.1 DeoR family transcriptional regulator [Marinitoga sp. 1155]NUU98858.1 DeoR family transcriptional regulator [Marinitoga sp. 1154]
MFAEERQKKILNFIKNKGKASVNELSKFLNVSAVTIRKDLSYLEELGKVIRTHGGAILPDHAKVEWNFLSKIKQMSNEKKIIAKKAYSYIQEDDTVVLDSSSTNYYIAELLKEKHINGVTIITNNIYIAEKLVESHYEIILLGGTIRTNSFSIVGPWSIKLLKELNLDIAFLGTTGISKEKGFMVANFLEAELKKAIINSSEKKFIVADSSKFSKKSFVSFADFKDITGIISGNTMPIEFLTFFDENKIKIDCV